MTDRDADAIQALARQLYDERITAGWSETEQDAYADAVLRRTVSAIAARGELAGLAEIIRMVTPNLRYAEDLAGKCTAIIQEARQIRFPGNTGWTWDTENERWTARRGTALVTAAWPAGEMPFVPADRFAVQLTGPDENVIGIMTDPGEENLPWSHPVLAEIPSEFWSDDWLHGIRSKTYLGMLCSPCGRTGTRVCLQPARESQAEGMEPGCVPVNPDHVRIRILDGKLSDYS